MGKAKNLRFGYACRACGTINLQFRGERLPTCMECGGHEFHPGTVMVRIPEGADLISAKHLAAREMAQGKKES